MGRGVSSGGGQSSLGYLFGSDEPPRQRPNNRAPPPEPQQPATKQTRDGFGRNVQTQEKPTGNNMPAAGKVIDDSGSSLEMGAGRMGRNNNNYFRAEGQNAGNFITDRPSTKVQAAPGGGSSLGYLFGEPSFP